MYESIDDNFLTRYFGKEEDDGDLYKCQWGLKNNGSGNDWSGATYLKDTLNSMSREAEGKTYILVFHFTKPDNNYSNYYMWIWTIHDGIDVPMIGDSEEATVKLNSSSIVPINSNTVVVNYIVKDGPAWNNVNKIKEFKE